MRTEPKNNPQPCGKTEAANHVGSGDWLGDWCIRIKSPKNLGGETDILDLRTIDDCRAQLAEMLNYPGPMAVLIKALEREGVRFNESDFPNEDITHLNQYVAVIGGEAAEFLHRACESLKSRSATHQAGENLSLGANGSSLGRLDVTNLSSDVIHNSKNAKSPNEKS